MLQNASYMLKKKPKQNDYEEKKTVSPGGGGATRYPLRNATILNIICHIIVFKSLLGLAPAYLLNEFSHARDFHSYNTRHRDLLRLPLARTTKYQGSFRFSGAKNWNTLPLAMRSLRSKHDFNRFEFGLKRHFGPSQIKPPILSLYLVVPLFLSVIVFCVVFFLFIRAPFKPSSELGIPD